ncbi:MAG: hypothetical protein M3Z64_07300 [Verrucomicrobiota bacterium]|nr:hypothetical protein [Verrucomicrobiota bacterium]
MSDLLKEEETPLSRPAATAQSPPSAVSSSPASDQKGAAFTAYRSRVVEYDFAGALQVVTALKSGDPTLRKKARWLMEWKKQFIDDLRRGPLVRPIADMSGATYQGISAADPARVTLMLPYGVTAMSWAKLSPKSLLEAAGAFIVPGNADAADRQWRSAVFAAETGQNDSARILGETAAAAKPEYGQDLRLLSAAVQTPP